LAGSACRMNVKMNLINAWKESDITWEVALQIKDNMNVYNSRLHVMLH
jgi:hypothetical protein